jgi:signal transduction histidine kinase
MELMDRANSASLDADAAYDRLVQSDALRADGLARTIDRQLLLLGLLAGIALVLGSVATIALLRYALRALRAFVIDVQQRLEDLDLVAARIVHDIRQPLTVVGLALMLAVRNTTDASTKARLGRALEILGRLGRTSEALLQFSRAGKPTDPTVSTEASEVAREVVEELRAAPEADGIEWVTALSTQARVSIGRDALRVVMANLIGNAVKYLECRARKRIAVSVREEGDAVEIRVEDTGPGFPAEHLSRLFEPFYRATTEKPGFGLGLATVRRLVTAYGGEIRLSSVVDQGTRFDILFPRPAEEVVEPQTGAHAAVG